MIMSKYLERALNEKINKGENINASKKVLYKVQNNVNSAISKLKEINKKFKIGLDKEFNQLQDLIEDIYADIEIGLDENISKN